MAKALVDQPGSRPAGFAKLAVSGAEMAEMLSIGERFLAKLTGENKVPHLRCGDRVLYPVARVRAWLEEQTRGGLVATPPIPPALLNEQDAAAVCGGITPEQLRTLGLPTVTVDNQTLYPVAPLLRRVEELAQETR